LEKKSGEEGIKSPKTRREIEKRILKDEIFLREESVSITLGIYDRGT